LSLKYNYKKSLNCLTLSFNLW